MEHMQQFSLLNPNFNHTKLSAVSGVYMTKKNPFRLPTVIYIYNIYSSLVYLD